MYKLDLGSIVSAPLSIGRHPAIVLSTKKEIASSGNVSVVAISKNTTISLPEDRIPVPGLGLNKCFVQCDVTETIPANQVTLRPRKAYGPFLESVLRQVKIARDRK